ncbi:MAG: divergent polysaccharide deacetylase family protein [Pseudomonadota bacterium]
MAETLRPENRQKKKRRTAQRVKKAFGALEAGLLAILVAAWAAIFATGDLRILEPRDAGADVSRRLLVSLGDEPSLRSDTQDSPIPVLGSLTFGLGPIAEVQPAKPADYNTSRLEPPIIPTFENDAPDTNTRVRRVPVKGTRPKIALVLDDVGLDPNAFDVALELPGPITLSFLPYAKNLQPMVSKALSKGHRAMLHLPMEPIGGEDPGPNALRNDMDAATLSRLTDWHLDQFDGYLGVNNHMGSAVSLNTKTLAPIMRRLAQRTDYFLDSVTIAGSQAEDVARMAGMQTFKRDIFIDSDDDPDAIRAALEQLEKIANERGVAIGILHPRQNTFDLVGPWLTTAPLRGYDIVSMDELAQPKPRTIASVTY